MTFSRASLLTTPIQAVSDALATEGLWMDYGATTLRVRSDSNSLAKQIKVVYPHFAFADQGSWADLHIEIARPRNLRRWIAPQVTFESDGHRPFEPFPADSPLPLLEWGCNWLIGRRLNHMLLLHAGAVERDGRVLLLPAVPGSGKSTLSAALSLRDWRLLSDEFGAWDPTAGAFRAMLKPVALKNQSIAVIRAFAPHAALGPEFPKTRKGTVAHLAASESAVARRGIAAAPGAVILPKWVAGSKTRLTPLLPDRLFRALAFNAFNYAVLGDVGFDAVVHLVRSCPAWTLEYSELEEALAAIDSIWPQVLERHARQGSGINEGVK